MEKIANGLLKGLLYFILFAVFTMFSFYLVANIKHYSVVRNEIYKDEKDLAFAKFSTNLDILKSSISGFKLEKYSGNYSRDVARRLSNAINACIDNIESEELINFKKDSYIDYKDLYELSKSFEGDVINSCIVSNLSFILSYQEGYFGDIAPYMNLEFSSISRESSFLKNELLGNSSYYFNASGDLEYGNGINSIYGIILNNYNAVLDILLQLTTYLNGGV